MMPNLSERNLFNNAQQHQGLNLKNPEEELAYLKERIKALESIVTSHESNPQTLEKAAFKEIKEYQKQPTEKVLAPEYKEDEHTILQKALELEKEEHDKQIEKLLKMIESSGIKNTLSVVEKLGSAHLLDDFHRALVQYVLKGLPGSHLSEKSPLWKATHMALYEVQLSDQALFEHQEKELAQDLQKLLSSMEQFLLGMLSINEQSDQTFSIEIAKPQGTEHVSFYVAVPVSKKSLFEKHLISVFPYASVKEQRSDYNIFTYGGAHSGAYLELEKDFVYPIKLFNEFTHDPLNIILAAFSKMSKFGEGAALQIVIGNEGLKHNEFVKKVIENLNKGMKPKKAIFRARTAGKIAGELADALKEMIFNVKPKDESQDQIALEEIKKKSQSRIVPVNIRLVSSAKDATRSQEILENMISAFKQFENPYGNKLVANKQDGWNWNKFLEDFVFRYFNEHYKQLMSLYEIIGIYHLTAVALPTSRELKRSDAKTRPAPIEVSEIANTEEQDGEKTIILGKNVYAGKETLVRFLPKDRLRHFYEIGQTGTGKTYLMKSMIIQDILNGAGVCYIDPHGSDIQDILAYIPKERYDDVIYFDPSYVERPYGLNMYEYDPNHPEQKSFVVDEMLSIFEKLFSNIPEALGPAFQQYFRNASLLIVDDPNDIGTIADVPRVMADSNYRHKLLERTTNPLVKQFWQAAEATSGEQSLANYVPYITSKTDIFLSNEYIRPIIAQKKSTINFSDIMNNRKIFLANLSKGKIGEMNASLLGLIIVGKLLQAAFARVDIPEHMRAPFYLYIDEFQNFTTPSIATILSEARKYKLSLNVAHQFLAQLDEKIRDAVFGNVGTKCVFRISSEDGEFFEKVLGHGITAQDVTTQKNYNAYVSLLVNGVPTKPFSMQTLKIEHPANYDQVEYLKQLSFQKYGRPRQEVEEEIRRNYMQDTLKERPTIDSFF